MKFIFKRLSAIAVLACLLAGCGEKTPEQLAAENKRALEISVKRAPGHDVRGATMQKAAELLEETSQKHGDDAALCEALAYSYAQIGRGAEAAIFFEKASDISGGSVQMLVNAAKAYEQAGQFQSAARAYEKYLKIKPRDMIAWKSLSGCHEKMSKYQDALNAYLEGVKSRGANPDTREACDIGNLFLKVGNPVQGAGGSKPPSPRLPPKHTDTGGHSRRARRGVSGAEGGRRPRRRSRGARQNRPWVRGRKISPAARTACGIQAQA